jgi:hypothetical protein
MREALAKAETVYESPLAIIAELMKEEVSPQGELFCHVNPGRVMYV